MSASVSSSYGGIISSLRLEETVGTCELVDTGRVLLSCGSTGNLGEDAETLAETEPVRETACGLKDDG
jgi:hypothetical protein